MKKNLGLWGANIDYSEFSHQAPIRELQAQLDSPASSLFSSLSTTVNVKKLEKSPCIPYILRVMMT